MRSRLSSWEWERGPAAPRMVSGLLAIGAAILLGGAFGPVSGQTISMDTTDLGAGRHAAMSMRLERTIFQVDVLTLDVVLDEAAAVRLGKLLADDASSLGDAELADSVAAIALDAHGVLGRIEFLRDVGLDRFLGGLRDNLRRARAAGLITTGQYEEIAANLPGWYDFLAPRGPRDGDRMFQRLRGDTLRTIYLADDGEVVLDQVDIGPERRGAMLGGYFAPGSDFRQGLIESLLESVNGSGPGGG